MKILQIVPSISLVYGGPSQMVLGFSAALAAKGVEVTVLTTDSNGDIGQPPLDVPLNQPVMQDGYQIRYFRCFPFRRYKFSFNLLRWLYWHAHEFDLAHIHALFSPVSTAAAAIARWRCLPYILRPLGTLDPADLQKKKQLKRLYVTLFERANLAGAAALHFTSQIEAKISERFGVATKDLIIPLGVSLPPEPAGEVLSFPPYPKVLFMSRIEPKKGLDILLPALEILLNENIEFHFILAGSNPQNYEYEKQIKERIKASPLARCTTITGFVSGELKASLLRQADVFVLPSYYENFGIAVAEAMAAGIPVIISERVYIWEEVQEAEAGWVSKTEIQMLASLLREALQNPAERKRRGLKAREYALKYYSWEAIASRAIEAYQQILANQTKK